MPDRRDAASGVRLKNSRERAALTQEQVAKQLDVPRELVSMWETEARTPGAEDLEALAQLYRVTPGYLTGAEERSLEQERAVLYEALPARRPVREAFDRWLGFLDKWAGFLEAMGRERAGPGKPPRRLDHGSPITDARRAPTLADEVRDYYRLGRNALPHLRAFLDERGILVYRAALGRIEAAEDAVAGAFYNHGRLGFCVLVNTDASPGRQAFSIAHTYAHALYHYAERGIVCRTDADDPIERLAHTFSPHFLVPRKKLRQMVGNVAGEEGLEAYQVVYLASYFRVSYPTTLRRLLTERHITEDDYARMRQYSPQALATRIGLDPEHFREADPMPLSLDRYPMSVLKTVLGALQRNEVTLSAAAHLLDVAPEVIEAVLLTDPPLASPRELREFYEFPR